MNDAKREIETEAISDEEVDWGDNSPRHLNLLRIGVLKQIIRPSIYLLEGL